MKGYLFAGALAALTLVGIASMGGCSSSSSGGGGGTPSGTYCDVTTAGVELCTGVSGAGDTSSFTSNCTMSGGKIVSSCPTANSLGCCTISGSNGASASSCSYCPSTETQDGAKTACTMGNGTFAAGAVSTCPTGDGGGSSSSSGSGSSSGSSGGDASSD
jgi:hypothetical protein